MSAVVSLNRGQIDRTDASIARISNAVPTTLYDLLRALQRLCGPDSDDFVISLVVYWLLSGHLRLPKDALHEYCYPHGGFVHE